MAEENPATFEKIKSKLNELNISYNTTHHDPVRTSEEAAQIRGSKLESGAKAILMKWKGKKDTTYTYTLFVMSAVKKLDSKRVKTLLGAASLSFAPEEDVKQITGCLPGAVPPFGSVFNVKTYMDKAFQEIADIDFNAGLRTDSIKMKREDYEKAESPVIEEFTSL